MAKDRVAELQGQIEELQRKRRSCVDEGAKHERNLAQHRSDLETLSAQRSQACELEAQGLKNDLASIDAKIRTTSDRIHGCERLIASRHEEGKAVDSEAQPLHQELREITMQAEINKQVGEIAAEEKQAMADIVLRDAINARLRETVANLRARGFHPSVTHAAADAAERIARVSNGMRP